MFLRGLRIENFRAIRHTTIDFDESTALIGENDCGISSVLDALELALGFDEKKKSFPPYLFHRDRQSGKPAGPIRIQLRFRERQPGEWDESTYEPFHFLLPGTSKRLREIWYETLVEPDENENGAARYRLRSPGSKARSSDARLIGRFRRMNPLVRVSAGMLSGHGGPDQTATAGHAGQSSTGVKVSAEVRELMEQISHAVDARLTRSSLNLSAELDRGFQAASRLVELGGVKLGKWESGLSRLVTEILGWHSDRDSQVQISRINDPDSEPERLGILLLIGALVRARPGGLAPDADPLWVLEEPEAHLHPITLTSVALFVGLIQRQKIVTTYSADLLANIPLGQVRRLVRHNGELHQRRVHKTTLSRSEMRRFHYHLRTRFGVATFARLWLLVEGESEFWILPQLARLMGYEFALEGIACVEFAQCGLEPPIKAARDLGIQWHLLADGDTAGQGYAQLARKFLGQDAAAERLTLLRERDIEHCFWAAGYQDIYRKHSRIKGRQLEQASPAKVIQAAVRKRSKPFLALSVVEAVAARGPEGIPPVLREMIETCVHLAREAPRRLDG